MDGERTYRRRPRPGQVDAAAVRLQFHRARFRQATDYSGEAQGLKALTDIVRVPIRIDLRDYARWASSKAAGARSKEAKPSRQGRGGLVRRTRGDDWPHVERFIADQVGKHSGGRNFKVDDLSTLLATEPVLLALDGLTKVANLEHRDLVANEIARAGARLHADAHNLVIIVATRPGMTTSPVVLERLSGLLSAEADRRTPVAVPPAMESRGRTRQ